VPPSKRSTAKSPKTLSDGHNEANTFADAEAKVIDGYALAKAGATTHLTVKGRVNAVPLSQSLCVGRWDSPRKAAAPIKEKPAKESNPKGIRQGGGAAFPVVSRVVLNGPT
jgi:hypothetical protein